VIDQHGGKPINLPALLYLSLGSIPGLRPENQERVSLQVERFLHESPDFELRKGKSGGVFRTTNEPSPKAVISKGDNYTCKGCGNTKLNNISDKSCWSCGRTVGT
jgi:rubrerythrin